MASKYIPNLHDDVSEGMDYTTPPHLIGGKWRHTHNMRLTPRLEQVPRKKVHDTVGSSDILHIGIIPGREPSTGTTLLFTPTSVLTSTSVSLVSGLSSDATFRRWSTVLYNGAIYYTNELNQIRRNNGSSDAAVTNAPKARYVTVWYDHLVAAYPVVNGTTFPNRLKISDLYRFDVWDEAKSNEAEHYDFVEWQSQDAPYTGITGIGKLRGTLWIYTPTALIPVQYVGLPKVLQVVEQGIVQRTGNTFPWTMVPLDNVHFYFDYQEHMFFAFDGQQTIPIGEAVRDYLIENLNSDYELASKMYGYVDTDNREIWWPFVSSASSGNFDKAVVFNYRYKRWFTASVENVLCFCKGTQDLLTVSELTGEAGDLTGTVADLGVQAVAPRLYGSDAGDVLTDGTDADVVGDLLAQDDIVLETADFHFGDIRTTKENDVMILNAYWDVEVSPSGLIQIWVKGRNFLSEPITWASIDNKGNWTMDLQDSIKDYQAVSGRVFRYKFVGKNLRGLQFSAWSDLVRLQAPEK